MRDEINFYHAIHNFAVDDDFVHFIYLKCKGLKHHDGLDLQRAIRLTAVTIATGGG